MESLAIVAIMAIATIMFFPIYWLFVATGLAGFAILGGLGVVLFGIYLRKVYTDARR